VYLGKHEQGVKERRKAIKEQKAKVIPFADAGQGSLLEGV